MSDHFFYRAVVHIRKVPFSVNECPKVEIYTMGWNDEVSIRCLHELPEVFQSYLTEEWKFAFCKVKRGAKRVKDLEFKDWENPIPYVIAGATTKAPPLDLEFEEPFGSKVADVDIVGFKDE